MLTFHRNLVPNRFRILISIGGPSRIHRSASTVPCRYRSYDLVMADFDVSPTPTPTDPQYGITYFQKRQAGSVLRDLIFQVRRSRTDRTSRSPANHGQANTLPLPLRRPTECGCRFPCYPRYNVRAGRTLVYRFGGHFRSASRDELRFIPALWRIPFSHGLRLRF